MNRKWIWAGGAMLLLAVVLLWQKSHVHNISPRTKETITDKFITQTQATPNEDHGFQKPQQDRDEHWRENTYAQLPPDREPGYNPNLPQWSEWRRRRLADPDFEWKMPIEFWGRVVDQEGKPVAGAAVRFGWNDVSGSNERHTQSDPQGKFSITGIRGKFLSVSVWKEGYHAKDGKAGKGFKYAAFFEADYHQPDPDEPVVFELVRKLEGEPLVAGRRSKDLSYGEESWYLDIESMTVGRVMPITGLKMKFHRGEGGRGEPFDWAWTVEGVNAGLQPTDDEFAQMAPEEGYVSRWADSGRADDERFRQTSQTRLYIRTGDGRHAVVDLALALPNWPERGPNLVFDARLNPAHGSRILEEAPGKVTWKTRR